MDKNAKKFEKKIQQTGKLDENGLINDDSVENQNKQHNIKKEALGPNTRRKR